MAEFLSNHKGIEQPTDPGLLPQLKAIDFFCGGGGMTCSLRQAGINVTADMAFITICTMRKADIDSVIQFPIVYWKWLNHSTSELKISEC